MAKFKLHVTTIDDNDNIPKWHVVYSVLSRALYSFYKKHTDSPGQSLYRLCFNDIEFRTDNPWINKFEKDFNVKSLDPIHIFASINNNKQKIEKRIRVINVYLRLLLTEVKTSYDVIDFTGCPVLSIVHIIGARNESSQKEIWEAFVDVHERIHESLSIELFNKFHSWYGIEMRSFTIFLFWIDSSNFLPLDKNTVSFLQYNDKFNSVPKNQKEYRELLTKSNTALYRNLASLAHDIERTVETLSPDDNFEIDAYLNKRLQKVGDKIVEKSKIQFRIIAVKPLNGIAIKYSKVLAKNRTYSLYKCYRFEGQRIIYDSSLDNNLYSTEDTNLSISAIVGKNGTGKSTIVELILLAINNLSREILNKENGEFNYVNNINLELYFRTTQLYKLVIKNAEINIFQYSTTDGINYVDPTKIELKQFNLENFFYTICVNYSLYSFNSNHLGDWIKALFHKNDAYQTPVVIEPFRKEGNININRQEELLTSRLLANLLEPEQDDDADSFRVLTENLKAEKIHLSLNFKKIEYLYKNSSGKIIQFESLVQSEQILGLLFAQFKVAELPRYDWILMEYVKKYILKKLVSIARTYNHYLAFFDEGKNSFSDSEEYIQQLYFDKSHITNKLRQAINFLKYDIIKHETPIVIDSLATLIDKTKSENIDDHLSTIQLIPPSFFKVDIELTNKIRFDSLSSGEKQKIFSVNSMLYHLKNIDSVSSDKLVKYGYVNLVLDEVELYFHPELQRTYLSYLRNSIKKTYLNSIVAINICFVTHSPFILSDIPSSSILFLDEPNKKPQEEIKTFGANIHELLVNGFFMKNTIGNFALAEINEIIDFHENVQHAFAHDRTEELKSLRSKYSSRKQKFYFVMENLGENYISNIIKNHIENIEEKLNDTEFIDGEIKKLELQIQKLKRSKNVEN